MHMLAQMLARLPKAGQMLSANVALAAFTFATGVMLARALNPEGRGQLAALTVWTTTIAPLMLLGVHQFLAREAGRDGESAKAIYRHLYLISGVASTAGIAIYGVLALTVLPSSSIPNPSMWLAALIIPGSVFNAAQIQVELGRRSIAGFNYSRSAFALTYFAAVGTLFFLGTKALLPFVAALVLTSTLSAVLAGRLIARTLPREPRRQPRWSMSDTLVRSRGFGFAVLFTAMATQADKLILSVLFPILALGYFAVASAIAQMQHLLSEAFAQLFFSQMTRFKRASDVDVKWLSARLRQMVLLQATLCVGAVALLPPLVPYIYGPAFSESASLLYILLPAVALRALARPHEEVFRGLGMPRLCTKTLAAGTATTAVLLVCAASFQSLHGAAVAVLIGNASALAWALMESRRLLALRPVDALLPRRSDAAAVIGVLVAKVDSK